MSTTTEPDNEPIQEGTAERMNEERATLFTRSVVEGVTEASHAFVHELEGTNQVPELMGRSVAGIIRANARVLDELATLVRQMTDDFAVSSRAPTGDELDYERLADLVAMRLGSAIPGPRAAERMESEGRSRKG